MIEVTGNLWTYKTPDGRDPDVRVITTNGTVKKNGEAVMGRGCAAEAKVRWPQMALALGRLIQQRGNIPHLLVMASEGQPAIWSFPVKHQWFQKADLDLIHQSATLLVQECCAYADDWTDRDAVIVMPRPGCGNGRLNWEDVREVIAPILDDRFHVITF